MTENNNDIIDITPATVSPVSGGNAIYNKITDPLLAIEKMGEMIWGSGMFGCVKPEQGMVLAMTCLAEGKAPLELAKTYHIIEGKLTMRSDAMLGRYQMAGGKVKWLTRSDTEVKALWTHDGNEIEIGVTLEEFKKNGVALGKDGKLKTNWQKFPRQMLTARCVSEAVRLLAPQIVSGIYTPEEVQDFDRPAQPARQTPPKVYIEEREPIENPQQALNNRLDELLGKYEPLASHYLIEKKYLREGQSYIDLDAMTAQRILSNPSKILGILEALKEEESK